MSMNALFSEQVALVATIDPDEYTAADDTPLTSDWVDMSKFELAGAVIMIGDVAASVTITMQLEQAKANAAGTVDAGTAKNIVGKVTTAFDGDDDNTQGIINVRGEDLDVSNEFRWIRASVTVADSASPDAAAADLSVAIFGLGARYAPANDHDIASLIQIVD